MVEDFNLFSCLNVIYLFIYLLYSYKKIDSKYILLIEQNWIEKILEIYFNWETFN